MSFINSKKIAKNTLLLYVRMLLILGVSLYTSRVILEILGVDDFGIYNLIAGFVTFLAFISNSLVSAMQRFYNVALGEKDTKRYQEVFSMSINILVIFSLLILILGETLGLWFVYNHLNIPSNRFEAAIWVYHISLLTFIANTLRTPYHASIIAHERMSFYAYISLFEVFLRLGLIFLLTIIPGDHLVVYSITYLAVILLVNIIYILYCKNSFSVCKYKFKKDRNIFKELLSFSSWTLLGQASVVVKNQGEAILINRFFSVAANAAMGVAVQVAGALEMFVSNFQTAFKPQLIQTYAAKDFETHYSLLYKSSKYSYFLLLIMFIPLVSNIDFILNLWLVDVPLYTNYFIVYILISYLFNALSNPLMVSIFASGKIREYQILFVTFFLAGLILIYFVLKLGAEPYSVSVVAIVIQVLLLFSRLYYAKKYIKISYTRFTKEVIIPSLLVTIFSFITMIPNCLNVADNILDLIISVLIDSIFVGVLVLLMGLSQTERKQVINLIKNRIRK